MSLKPTLLLVLDGWGIAPAGAGNAVHLAKTPHLDALIASRNSTSLACSGRAVGLPDGFMGNSEVGHMSIGAGRIIYQDMTRIDMAIEQEGEGSLAHNAALTTLIADTKARGGRLHLMGLLSDGGVHSHMRHLMALIAIAREAGLEVMVHGFLDGRDRSPTSGVTFVEDFLAATAHDDGVHLATLIGRYYALDRDKRWERNELAWNALVHGKGDFVGEGCAFTSPLDAIKDAYAKGITDEFITPLIMAQACSAQCAQDAKENGTLCPVGTIDNNDGVFFFNFRADRARQLVHIFKDTVFEAFERGAIPELAGFVTMTQYDSQLPVSVAFPRQSLGDTLGEVVSKLDLPQLRIAETEKYAHVTYFFNCGREDALPLEDRTLLPSPRDVATYDLKPEMSAEPVTDALLEAWAKGTYPLVVCNLANLDMVGHTGFMEAAIKACEVVDACVARIIDAVQASGGCLMVTADHGNAEELLSPEGSPHTAHTLNRVPFVLIDGDARYTLRHDGILGDIAPTILHLWNVEQPALMTGKSLIIEDC